MKKIYKTAITIILITVILSQINFQDFLKNLTKINLSIYIPATLLIIPIIMISALRWQAILNKIDSKIPYKKLLKYELMSLPFSTITPSKAGDFIRAVFLKKDKVNFTKGLLSVIIDRSNQVLVITILSIFGAIVILNQRFEVIISLVFLLVLIFLLLNKKVLKKILNPLRFILKKIFKNENISTSFQTMYNDLISFLSNKNAVFKTTLLMFTEIMIYYLQLKMIFISLGYNPSIIEVVSISSIASIAVLLPITLSGFGVREGIAILLYKTIGIPSEITLIVYMLIAVVNQLLFSILGLILFQKQK